MGRQKALSHFGALYVIPIFTVIGIIYFEEYKSFTALTASLFTVGILVTVIGVAVLSIDVAKLFTELYDNYIKVAFVEYETVEYKYAQTVTIGGPTSEYLQQYFLKKPAVCYNPKLAMNVQQSTEAAALKSDND